MGHSQINSDRTWIPQACTLPTAEQPLRAARASCRTPGGEECVVWGMRAHVDLPVFGAQMRETWNFAPPAVPAGSWAPVLASLAAQGAAGGETAEEARAGLEYVRALGPE